MDDRSAPGSLMPPSDVVNEGAFSETLRNGSWRKRGMKDPRIRTPLLAPSMRLVSSLMRLSIATLLMVLLWGACGDDGWVPEVVSVEVIPHKVFALAGESFLLQARIRDPDVEIINMGGFYVDPWEA